MAYILSVNRLSVLTRPDYLCGSFGIGITYDYDSSIGKGYVIYQQYQANSLLDKGTTIDIQVSSGPEPEPETPDDSEDEDTDSSSGDKDKSEETEE